MTNILQDFYDQEEKKLEVYKQVKEENEARNKRKLNHYEKKICKAIADTLTGDWKRRWR